MHGGMRGLKRLHFTLLWLYQWIQSPKYWKLHYFPKETSKSQFYKRQMGRIIFHCSNQVIFFPTQITVRQQPRLTVKNWPKCVFFFFSLLPLFQCCTLKKMCSHYTPELHSKSLYTKQRPGLCKGDYFSLVQSTTCFLESCIPNGHF